MPENTENKENKKPQTKEYEVVKATIKDVDGNKRHIGERVSLTNEMAKPMLKSGVVREPRKDDDKDKE